LLRRSRFKRTLTIIDAPPVLSLWEAKMNRRDLVSAWLFGGAVWVLGLLGLFVLSPQSPEGELSAGADRTRAYYLASQTATLYQDPSGKYTVVVRAPGPAAYF